MSEKAPLHTWWKQLLMRSEADWQSTVELYEKVAQLPFLQFKCSRTVQMVTVSRKGYFSSEVPPFQHTYNLLEFRRPIPWTLVKSCLKSHIFEKSAFHQCSWTMSEKLNQLPMHSWIWSRICMISLFEPRNRFQDFLKTFTNSGSGSYHLDESLCRTEASEDKTVLTCEYETFQNVWGTLYRKSDLCIPRNETARPRSQFLYSCICDRFWEYINRSQITWMWTLGNRTL
jgi:hypothetical protein